MNQITRLIIWGYKLPPTDFYSEWLLMKVKHNKKIKEIILINPSEDDRIRLKNIFINLGVTAKIFEYQFYKEYLEKVKNA